VSARTLSDRRTVAVIDLEKPPTESVQDGTDVAVVVLKGHVAVQQDLLRDVRGRVEVVMGIVLGGVEETTGPGLASLREFADIIAHAGDDTGIVDDVVATLTEGHPQPAHGAGRLNTQG
jgi:hypothetical protein